jgi:hypothetical protein
MFNPLLSRKTITEPVGRGTTPLRFELRRNWTLLARYGARRKGHAVLSERVEQLLASLEVRALDPGIDRTYAEVRCALESKGRPIGANDTPG